MLSTFTNSALVVLVAALVSTTTSAESIGLRNFIEEQPGVGDPCTSDPDCFPPSANMYCKFPTGSCGEDGQSGVCTVATRRCTRIYKPVCTCDGNTASTECTAGAVSIRSEGECPPEPEPEPEDRSANGGCMSNADCGPSVWDYCKFPLGSCGEDGQPGECAKATPACNRNLQVVCTCEGNTAANHCTAGAVSLRSEGECPSEPSIDTAIE